MSFIRATFDLNTYNTEYYNRVAISYYVILNFSVLPYKAAPRQIQTIPNHLPAAIFHTKLEFNLRKCCTENRN